MAESPFYPPPPPGQQGQNPYYSWGTAVYATLTAVAILLSVSGCLVMLNRTYWRPRRLRRAAAAAAATRVQMAGKGNFCTVPGETLVCLTNTRTLTPVVDFDAENPTPRGPLPKWKVPVVVVQPGGNVELATKDREDRDESSSDPTCGASPQAEPGQVGPPDATSLSSAVPPMRPPEPRSFTSATTSARPSYGTYIPSTGAGAVVTVMQGGSMGRAGGPAWPRVQLIAPARPTPRYGVRTRVHQRYTERTGTRSCSW